MPRLSSALAGNPHNSNDTRASCAFCDQGNQTALPPEDLCRHVWGRTNVVNIRPLSYFRFGNPMQESLQSLRRRTKIHQAPGPAIIESTARVSIGFTLRAVSAPK